MSEMIERVARALCARHYAARFGKPANDPHVLMNVDGNWQMFRDDARAAIEAMREPTPKMLRAACAAMSPGKRPTEKRVSERAKHGIRHRAIIDAALTEVVQP